MQIIIPMSGEGARFKRAGYADPKPLIKVHGRPIIEYVTRLFPGETDVTFICRQEHLESTDMREVLSGLVPTAKILSIPGHKFGPVHAVYQVAGEIRDDEPVVVNYCDFFMSWDWEDFKRTVAKEGCDGSVPAYRGFHPNLLHPENFYASMRVDQRGYMEEIREKHSFTADKGESPQSPGTYYFKDGRTMKKYFRRVIEEDVSLGGEFYASLVYNLLKEDGLGVYVYDRIPYFCQWGTPKDLQEYEFWTELVGNHGDTEVWFRAEMKFPQYDRQTIGRIIEYWQGYLNAHPEILSERAYNTPRAQR